MKPYRLFFVQRTIMATDSLYRIIKAMSTGEKIHFKRSMNKKSDKKEPAYLILFDIIDNIKVYDKTAIAKKIKAKKIKFNYNETKNYLQGLLIEFIENYHSESTISLKAARFFRISRIMFEKGLYEEAWEYLKKVKEIAEKHQMYEMMLQIYSHEVNLMWDNRKEDRFSSIEKKLAEKKQTIHHVVIINQYLEVSHLMGLLFGEESSVRDKEVLGRAENLYNKIQHLPETTLFYPNFIKHSSYIHFFSLTQNFVKQKEHCRQVIELCRQNPEMAKRFNASYYSILEQYLMAMHFFNDYSNYNTILTWYSESLGHLEKHLVLSPVFFKEFLWLDMQITKGEIKLAANQAMLLNPESFEPSSNVIILAGQYRLILKYACVSFLNKQYKVAQLYVQKILDEFNLASTTGIQIHYTAKMLQLLISYERKDYILLEDLIQSTQRYFLRHQKLYELEVMLFSFFKKLLQDGENIFLWKEVKSKLEKFDNYFLREYFGFDIITWVDSKIQQRPIATILKEKAEKYYPEIFEVRVVLEEDR